MEQDMQKKLDEQTAKLDAIFVSVEKTRKYFLVTLWISVLVIILPLIGLIIVVPFFISTFSQTYKGLL